MTSKYIPRKNWFLTYSQTPPGYLKEGLLVHLESIGELQEYVIAIEKHQDGGNHFHAYVKFKGDGVAPKDVLNFKWVDRTAKAESCRSAKAVIKYCKKDGDFITNIVNLLNYEVSKTKKMTQFLLENGVDKAVDDGKVGLRGLKRLRDDVANYKLHQVDVEPTNTCKGIWIYGPTGAGKTTEALRRFPEAFRKPPTKWWDGYQGEEVVLLDDLRKTHAEFIVYYLTQYMDRHAPPAGEVKGGNLPLPFKWFVVTSQWSIEDIFEEPRDREAIYRRCQGRIYHYVDGREVDDTQPPRSDNMAEVPEYDVVPDATEVRRIVDAYAPPDEGGADSASAGSVLPHNGLRQWQ